MDIKKDDAPGRCGFWPAAHRLSFKGGFPPVITISIGFGETNFSTNGR